MPTCRKCKGQFPRKTYIDGRQRNLQNRKFCLECSPFGLHNTNPKEPGVKKRISEKQKQYYPKQRIADNHRKKQMKIELVNSHGGKCIKCGYDKCIKALCFHHRNPNEKLFPLDVRSISSRSKASVLAEATKCDLLCACCHIETHDEIDQSTGKDSNLGPPLCSQL